MKKPKTPTQLVTGWIKLMQKNGLTPDDMLRVIQLAKEKFNGLKKNGN